MALDPVQREQLLKEAGILQEFIHTPAWAILQRLIGDETDVGVTYLLTLTDPGQMQRQIGAINGLQRALTLPDRVILMAREAV